MEFLELAKSRFSVLNYDTRSVEQEIIEKVLASALAAPTACNNQPQRILVIQDDEGRKRLNRVVPSRRYVPIAFLVCYDKTMSWVRPMDGKNSGEIDAAIVATHMMMELTDLGLGSIWVMYWDPAAMKREFALKEELEPVALLIAGYHAPDAKPRKGHLESVSLRDIRIEPQFAHKEEK